jgi:(p)ppGpp synthase/HD superfamily hydrolase
MYWNPDIYKQTWEYATLAHQEQKYGGATEGLYINYLNHLASVAMEVMTVLPHHTDLDGDLAVQVALLHDILEDTPMTHKQLVSKFGNQITDGVKALTKNTNLPKEEQMQDSLDRIKKQPHEIWLVKMGDRITNLYHPPFYWKKEKIESYRQEAIIIYENLKEASEILSNRLWRKIEAYQQFTVEKE